MANFVLKRLEGGDEISVPNGKITVGRGPLLRIIDKRVSRHHAVIEVSDSTFKLLPIHTNPTFYKGSGATKFEPLEKDQAKELKNGDCIAFLPNDLVFKILKKGKSFSEINEDKIDGSQMDIGQEDVKIVSDELEGTNGIQMAVCEEKKELNFLPLKKTRKLPSWMTNSKDQTPAKIPKKGGQTKTQKNKTSNETSVVPVSEEEKKKECDLKDSIKVDGEDKTIANHSIAEEREQAIIFPRVTEDESKKRKQPEEDNPDQATKRRKHLPPCPFGNHCYRKNPAHFEEYSHGEKSAQSGSDESVSEDESEASERPQCPYGTSCYRKNPQHRKEYRHTEIPKTREKRVKTKTELRGIQDDDDGPNDYDYEDSFINDESESSCEPSDHDSDWQPDDEETSDEEDVGQLLSEARDFTKNTKMLKPS